MEDLRTQAQLVAPDRAGAIGTVITRAEIAEAAAGTEFPATLLLELDRGTEQARVAVEWDEDTLEQLLAGTQDEEIGLWFDEQELARAFDEVEAHGLREKAAVLAVAVIAAGASAAPSLAAPASSTDGGPSVVAAHTPGFSVDPRATGHGAAVQPAGAERALLQDENIAVQQTQGDTAQAPTATTTSTGSTSTGTSSLSAGELAAAAGGVLLISAAGFGVSRKRRPPALPA